MVASTDQPISETAVANMACTTLDESHITSLDDDGVLARFFASQFGFVRNELLRSHPWAFAKKRAIIAPLADKPVFGWSYQYQVPDDCLRVLPLRDMGLHNGRLIPFEREGKLVLTDAGPVLYVHYIRKVTNASDYDPLFARAFGERLAVLAAQRVTGKAAYVNKALELYRLALDEAYRANALDYGTPETQDRSGVLDARLAG